METTVIQHETSDRRRKVTKFALAGVAVLGVGAALTSAAWSDNVWFGGATDAADFELQGWNGSAWENADDSANGIVLPGSAFNEIAPDIGDSYEFRVRNGGDIPIYLNDLPIVTVANGLSDAATDPAGNVEVTMGNYTATTLAPGAQARIVITLTGKENFLEETTGSVAVQIAGDSSTP
jgi:hypothetical protein